MEKYLKSTIEVEWIAQKLLQDFKTQGPLIHIVRGNTDSNHYDHILVIQGSFDPPLLSHTELINQSISLYQKQLPNAKVALMVLLSLSHVEKETDLFIHSLLGLRVEMLESLLSQTDLSVPWMIGISNSGRYIDLTVAIKRLLQKLSKNTYIMGIDVFDKLFQGVYYSKPLRDILPEIFQTDYIVAGRGDIVDIDDFLFYINSLPSESQNAIKETDNIIFLPLQKKFQFESSTKVRKQLSLDQSIEISSLNSQTLLFIHKNHLYSKNPSIIVIQIIVQIFVRILLKEGVDRNKCSDIIHNFISKNGNDKKIQTRILSEYRVKNNLFLEKRCYELLKEHSLIN
ncbi:hypothetical protein CEE45_14255 [Candidatus Heimdallarchaeota archaeon B3_Heim]|nr:MAG: hypothetical protein CEE45_14255 [Candidatus Heimdallarchaeota archaeon B3_Heim]